MNTVFIGDSEFSTTILKIQNHLFFVNQPNYSISLQAFISEHIKID